MTFNIKKICLFSSLLMISACSIFGSDKEHLDGERLAVLRESSAISPDFAQNEIKITLPKPMVNSRWYQNGGNNEHNMQHLKTNDSLKKFWENSFGKGNSKRDYLLASPIIAYNAVFTIDSEAKVKAFRLDDGKEIWSKRVKPLNREDKSSSMKGAGVAEFAKKIIATTGFGGVFALDMLTGEQQWRYDIASPIRIAPTVGGGHVYVQTIDNTLIAIDAYNGEERWKHKTATEATTLVGGAKIGRASCRERVSPPV